MPTKTLLTIAEFEKLAEKDGVRYELSEGELVEMTFPTPRHNLIVGRIYGILEGFVRKRGLGTLRCWGNATLLHLSSCCRRKRFAQLAS